MVTLATPSLAFGAALVLLLSARAHAQRPWSGSAQASVNALYGAAHARFASLEASLGRSDSTLAVRSDARIAYADDRVEAGSRVVTARASRASRGLDYLPYSRYSPFWFGSIESTLQQRIARRYNVGAGAKVTFVRDSVNELSVSLAALWESTRARESNGTVSDPTQDGRWSLRFRAKRQFTPALSASHVTFYQPVFRNLQRYVVDTRTEVENKLLSALSLAITWRDRIDSEAVGRGAPSAHDAQLLLGLRASF